MKKLDGKVAIVTGGAGGMGRAYAHRLAELGASVAIFDIDLQVSSKHGEVLTAASVVAELEAMGVAAMGVELDLSIRESVDLAVEQVVERFGRIDIVVNNAGGAVTPMDKSTASISPQEDTDRLFAVNFKTTVNVCQAVVPHLKKNGGAIVNVGTIGVEIDDIAGRIAMYDAAKAATMRYSRSLAVELGPYGIRVNCILPGIIETARIKAQATKRNIGTQDQSAKIPLRRLGQAEDVLGAMEYFVTDMSAYVTGEAIRVAGGMTLVAAV